MISQKIFTSSFIGILAKIIDAFAKFCTIPTLIAYYGKSDYGLIALAFSLNAYLRLMDMGMNTGAIRYFSIWLANKEYDKVLAAARTSIIFYGCIGCVNALILSFLGVFANSFFNLDVSQVEVFKIMLYSLALSAVFNWTAYVVNQLLIANGDIQWTNYSMIVSSLLNVLMAFLAVYFRLDLRVYFLLFVLSTLVIIPINIYRLRKIPIEGLIAYLFKLKWNNTIFKEIQRYSLAIFAMGVFQFSADNLRPILLGVFSDRGTVVLTDYRVLQTIVLLVSSMGAVFLQVLLPVASQGHAINDEERKSLLIFRGTKYITIFLSFLIFGLIINIDDLIFLFVGKDFLYLSNWLIINLLLMFYMHDYAISSIILSVGQTKVLVLSSFLGALVSITLTIVFAQRYGVGATVLSFTGFIFVQSLCNYLYYIPKVLKINGGEVLLKSFFPVCLGGGGICLFIILVYCNIIFLDNRFIRIILKSLSFSTIFILYVYTFLLKNDEKKYLHSLFKR